MTETLIRHYYDCFNARRLADAAALFADDADLDLMPGRPDHGGAGYVRFAETWIAAFPNAELHIQRVEHRSEQVCEVYLLATGTHRGVLDLGAYQFQPSAADARLHMRELLDVRDGKITAAVLTIDFNDLLHQLTTIDYDELARRVDRICGLRDALAQAVGDGRRAVANQLGVELDAARRAVRPHFHR